MGSGECTADAFPLAAGSPAVIFIFARLAAFAGGNLHFTSDTLRGRI